jgi:hypothetical protein
VLAFGAAAGIDDALAWAYTSGNLRERGLKKMSMMTKESVT